MKKVRKNTAKANLFYEGSIPSQMFITSCTFEEKTQRITGNYKNMGVEGSAQIPFIIEPVFSWESVKIEFAYTLLSQKNVLSNRSNKMNYAYVRAYLDMMRDYPLVLVYDEQLKQGDLEPSRVSALSQRQLEKVYGNIQWYNEIYRPVYGSKKVLPRVITKHRLPSYISQNMSLTQEEVNQIYFAYSKKFINYFEEASKDLNKEYILLQLPSYFHFSQSYADGLRLKLKTWLEYYLSKVYSRNYHSEINQIDVCEGDVVKHLELATVNKNLGISLVTDITIKQIDDEYSKPVTIKKMSIDNFSMVDSVIELAKVSPVITKIVDAYNYRVYGGINQTSFFVDKEEFLNNPDKVAEDYKNYILGAIGPILLEEIKRYVWLK